MTKLIMKIIDRDQFGAVAQVEAEGYPHEIAHALYAAYADKDDFLYDVVKDLLLLIKNEGKCTKTPSGYHDSNETKLSN